MRNRHRVAAGTSAGGQFVSVRKPDGVTLGGGVDSSIYERLGDLEIRDTSVDFTDPATGETVRVVRAVNVTTEGVHFKVTRIAADGETTQLGVANSRTQAAWTVESETTPPVPEGWFVEEQNTGAYPSFTVAQVDAHGFEKVYGNGNPPYFRTAESAQDFADSLNSHR